tara:strand:- start:1260 stop:2063 length:804 start_codon:yes stop_codon:yes gene_type:complete
MSYGAIAVTTIGAIVNLSNAAKNREMAEKMYTDAKIESNKQQAALEAQKQQYKNQVFKNPFAGMQNVYEDLTVNQQQAQFQAQQGAQQRANIMQGLRGAAGSSGIAGLAQAMANQGSLQTQRISANIGQQEAMNQRLAAKGAGAVQIAERQGDQWVQQAEMDRQATLLGMQYGQATGANLALQQSQANKLNAQIAQQQATSDMFSSAAGAMGDNFMGGSDNNMFTGQMREGYNVYMQQNPNYAGGFGDFKTGVQSGDIKFDFSKLPK